MATGAITALPGGRWWLWACHRHRRLPAAARGGISGCLRWSGGVRVGGGHIEPYGGDAARIALMGHSAGAYNAAMLALDPAYLGERALCSIGCVLVVGLSGPYDFFPFDGPISLRTFGACAIRGNRADQSRDGGVAADVPGSGDKDRLVYPATAWRWREAAEAGARWRNGITPRLGIRAIDGAGPAGRGLPPCGEVAAFLSRHHREVSRSACPLGGSDKVCRRLRAGGECS